MDNHEKKKVLTEKVKARIPLTVEQAAERYGLPKSSIYKLHHEGKIIGYKPFGRRLIFDLNELDDLVFANPTK